MSGEPTRWISRDRLRSADQKFVIQLKRTRGKTFFAVEIPLPLLKKWHNVVNEQASDRGRTSGQNSATGSETEQADSSQGQRKRRICGSSTVHLYLTRCSPLRIIKLWGKTFASILWNLLMLLCNYRRKPRKGQKGFRWKNEKSSGLRGSNEICKRVIRRNRMSEMWNTKVAKQN